MYLFHVSGSPIVRRLGNLNIQNIQIYPPKLNPDLVVTQIVITMIWAVPPKYWIYDILPKGRGGTGTRQNLAHWTGLVIASTRHLKLHGREIIKATGSDICFLAVICVKVNNWVQPVNYIKPCEKLNNFKILTWLRCQFSKIFQIQAQQRTV